jgi:hypothetical protein
MPLAAALAALAGASAIVSDPAEAKTTDPQSADRAEAAKAIGLIANRIVSPDEALLGFIVTKASDGTALAQHSLRR